MRTFDLKEVFFLHLKNSIYLTKKFKTMLLSGFELETDSIDLSGKPCYSNLNLDFFYLPALLLRRIYLDTYMYLIAGEC